MGEIGVPSVVVSYAMMSVRWTALVVSWVVRTLARLVWGGHFGKLRPQIQAMAFAWLFIMLVVAAALVLAAMGLTVSNAVRLMLTRVAQDKALPFEPLRPNATTIAAMEEARAGNLMSVTTIEELMAELNADD